MKNHLNVSRQEGKNKLLSPRTLILVIALLVVLIILSVSFFYLHRNGSEDSQASNPAPIAESLLGFNKVKGIAKGVLENDPEKDSIEGFLYPELIEPGTKIASWDPDEPIKEAEKYYYFAWIDRSPGNAFFAHPTEFIFIDAETGKYEKEAREFWPVIDEEPFEGDRNTLIRVNEKKGEESKKISLNLPRLDIMGWLIPAASAHPQGRYVHIEPPESDCDHEDYALIIAGFGKNSWVFMEGAHDMYKALKNQGYDDDHIYFLAQGPVEIDPAWDRKGEPKLNRVKDVVDTVTSPDNIKKAFSAIGKRMKKEDSLFVFVLAHGSKKKLQIGRELPDHILKNPKTTIGQALYGGPGSIKANDFAQMSVGSIKACEVMILFDSCYSGSQEPFLRNAYDPERIKRLQVAHSTNAKTISLGADLRDPVNTKYPAIYDMDAKAKKTKIADPNPADHGGEFSSGIIANLSKGIFSAAYGAGIELDAANLNGFTHPYIWMLGESGSCCAPDPEPLEDQNHTPATDPESGITLSPTDFSFSHKMGSSPCPTIIGTAKITGSGDGITWKITGEIPYWLSVSTRSGKTPVDLTLSFNCQLKKYVPQTLSDSIQIQEYADGKAIGKAQEIHIRGQIK